jgi:hypothetical protein
VEATAPAKTVSAAPKSEYPYGVNTTVKTLVETKNLICSSFIPMISTARSPVRLGV